MSEQRINEYYVNLEYNKSTKEESLTEISNLSKRLYITDVNNFSERFLLAASIIEKNVSLFKAVCKHADIVTTILEYLRNFGVKFMFGNDSDEEYNKQEMIFSIMLTILDICREPTVQSFLENAIINNSVLSKDKYDRLKDELLHEINEIILLQDSDLYAVMSYLKIRNAHINKIWVQVSIKQKLLWLLKKYFCHKDYTIRTFTSWATFTPAMSDNMNIISIWSEDIVGAKNLATFLNSDVIFINTHMDLYGGTILLPYVKVFDKIHQHKFCFNQNYEYTSRPMKPSIGEKNFLEIAQLPYVKMRSLFYNGKWQKPVKSMYWEHNDYFWANATTDDVKMCYDSAVKGFQTWKTWSTNDKLNLLRDLMETMKCHSLFLANIAAEIYPYINNIALPNKTSLFCSENDRLEVIQDRIPRGVIILKEKTEYMLFFRLIQILLSGNSVIVIADANSCSLAPYCDIFSTCRIPPGVINFLSNKNLSILELYLCVKKDYANYEKQFSFTSSNDEKVYISLTLPKPIVFSLK